MTDETFPLIGGWCKIGTDYIANDSRFPSMSFLVASFEKLFRFSLAEEEEVMSLLWLLFESKDGSLLPAIA